MALFPAPSGIARAAARTGRSQAHEAAPWIHRLARLGYGARGVVYLIVGYLAVQAAVTRARRPEDSQGALAAILHQPMGRVLLGIVAVGLAGFVLWRLVQSLADPEGKGSDLKGLLARGGLLISAALHALLAWEAVRLLMGSGGGGSGDRRTDHWTTLVMAQPLGRWIIGAVGAGTVAFGLYEIYKAVRSVLTKRLDLSGAGPGVREGVVRFARFGLAARGVVFGIIGWFLVQAALQYDPEEARDLSGALRALQDQPYGPWLLGAAALGLTAYGVYQLAEARYRRIRVE